MGAVASESLLERDRELTELGEVLASAREGRGRIALIEAPAGIGKTSLLRAACDSATEGGFTCLRARATELERDFAFGCLRQLLEPQVAKAPDPERDRLFEGAAALSEPLFAPTGLVQRPASPDSAFSMLHGLYWLLDNITDQGPVVLAVDDLHWSDAESMRFFNYLAPRLDGLSLAVLATTRSGENVTPELARLAAGPESIVLRPRPLSTGATARLCERRLGTEVAPEFAAACREATGGNPLFLEALLREVSERGLRPDASEAAQVREIGPAAVADAVLLRLADRPASATALVRAVAVIGDGASLAEAALLAELTDEEAALAADLLITLEILRSSDGLEFTHPIVREAVYTDIGAHERAQAHARAAQILVETGGGEERVAAQIVEAEPAGEPDRVELLRRVAADALSRGAPAAAVAWLRRGAGGASAGGVQGRGAARAQHGEASAGDAGSRDRPAHGRRRARARPAAALDLGSTARRRADVVRERRPCGRGDRVRDRRPAGRQSRAGAAPGGRPRGLRPAGQPRAARTGTGTAGALCRSPRRHPG